MKRVAKTEGEYIVLVQPELHHSGRREWVVMAVYDGDEAVLASTRADTYRQRGHAVAVAQIVLEDDDYPYDNAQKKRH